MKINRDLSLAGCWRMVNAIQNGKDPADIRNRCNIAWQWLMANRVITNDEYEGLMDAVTFLYRESYHWICGYQEGEDE